MTDGRERAARREGIQTQQDWVDNLIHLLIEDLTETERDWDIELTGAVREAVAGTLESYGVIAAGELYPTMPPEEDEEFEGEIAGGAADNYGRGNFKGAVAEIRSGPKDALLGIIAAVLLLMWFLFVAPLLF